MNFLGKIQNLPEKKKKIILWIITVFFGLILLFVWTGIVGKVFSNFKGEKVIEDINFPELNEENKNNIGNLESKIEELKQLENNQLEEKND